MIIDTKKRVIFIQLRRLFTLLGFIALVVAIILLGKLPNTFLGFNKYHWAIVVGLVYGLVLIIDSLHEFQYIHYNDESNLIVLRYYSLAYANKKKNSIEIPKTEFISFTYKSSLLGIKKKLILRRYFKDIEAKYPAVSLSILSKQELAALLYSLNSNSKSPK